MRSTLDLAAFRLTWQCRFVKAKCLPVKAEAAEAPRCPSDLVSLGVEVLSCLPRRGSKEAIGGIGL